MNVRMKGRMGARIAKIGLTFVALLAGGESSVSELRAQTPVAIPDTNTPVAITSNNTGSNLTYVLNADSSVSVLQNGGLVANAGCGPILTISGGVNASNAAIAFDSSSKRLYAVLKGTYASGVSQGSSLGTWVTYAAFNSNGTCAGGSSTQISTNGFGLVELAVDPAQGNVYVVEPTQGGSTDNFYVISIAGLTIAGPISLDYSSTYGPIVVDPTTHRVYVNDFGIATNLPPGLNPTPGFFVYDPLNSNIASSNLQHVFGYLNSTGGKVPLSAQALFVVSGYLFLANQNTSISSGAGATFQSSPFTVLNTTDPGFSFFTNTQAGPGGTSPSVYIQPGPNGVQVMNSANVAGLQKYSATGGADVDPVQGIIYRYAYDVTSSNSFSATPVQGTGALISFNFSTLQDSLLTPNGLPLANVYPTPNVTPWSQLVFNAKNNNVTLSAAGAVGVSESLGCNGGVTVQQVLGGGSTYAIIGSPAVNFTSGYLYDTQTVYPNTSLYFVAPPASCVGASLVLSPSSLPNGVAGQAYSPVNFSVAGGANLSGLTYQASNLPPNMGMTSGGSLGGTPMKTGTFQVTVQASDTAGDSGSEVIPLTISCPNIVVGPNPLPTAVIGVPYNVVFTSSGGVGSITWQAFGPFPPGVTFNGTGLSGLPTTAGSYPVGIQATDSNGCKSINLIQTVSEVVPKFSVGPAPLNGAASCTQPGPGIPYGILPTVTINNVAYFQLQLNLVNTGNVYASANITSATLGGIQAANPSSPGTSIFPVIFNNPGTLVAPGGCVSFSFYYPVTAYTSVPVPGGFTQVNIPQILRLQGAFVATTSVSAPYSGNWSLLARHILLSPILCCTSSAGNIASGSSGGSGATQ